MTLVIPLRVGKKTDNSWDITSCRLAVIDFSDDHTVAVFRVFLRLTLSMETLCFCTSR